jgi:hypothetical protein
MRTRTSVALVLLLAGLTACSGAAEGPADRAGAADTGTAADERTGSVAGAGAGPAANADNGEGSSADVWRELTVPAGTSIAAVLDTAVASDTSRVEDAVRAHLNGPVTIDGVTAFPAGSVLSGSVTSAAPAGRVKGRAHVALRFDTLTPPGPPDEPYAIQTAAISRTAPSTKQADALKIGVPAAGGAVIGGIVGGKKGAAIGAAAGGGAGTAVVLSERGDEVRLARGAAVTVKLTGAVTVRVRG